MNATQETTAADRPSEEHVRRYLQRRASADEEARIEAYLLEHPEFLDEIETEEIIRDGLEVSKNNSGIDADEDRGNSNVKVLQPRVKPGNSLLRWSIAASILLAVGLTSSLFALRNVIGERDSLRSLAALARNPVANVPVIWVGALRGVETIATIPRRTDGSPVVLNIAIADQTAERYRLSLQHAESTTPIVVIDDLVPQPDGNLSLALPTKDIPPGLYSLVTIGAWADGEREVLRLPVRIP
jgi:hypothetical protein